MSNKRSIECRLDALRNKLPKKAETQLESKIRQFLAVPCDQEHWEDAKKLVREIRDECMRTHGRDVWCVTTCVDAMRKRLEDFYALRLQHSLETCFESLELHVDNKLMIESWVEESGDIVDQYMVQREFTVHEFENERMAFERFEPGTQPRVKIPIRHDGIQHRVHVVERRGQKSYYAADATHEEMAKEFTNSSSRPEVVNLCLDEYLSVCLQWPRVHRKDSLHEAIFATLEDHIRRVDDAWNSLNLMKVSCFIEKLCW